MPNALNSSHGNITRGFLSLIVQAGDVTEILIKGTPGREGPIQLSGYFDSQHGDALIDQVLPFSGRAESIFYRINRLDPEVLARSPNKLVCAKHEITGSKRDIVGRRLLLVDIDPRAPGDRASATAANERAGEKAALIRTYLRERNWPFPITVDSGNGYHLLYAIDLAADDSDLVKNALKALAARFDDEYLRIDTSCGDPARMARLPGTRNCKRLPNGEVPRRLCRVRRRPNDTLVTVTQTLLEQLAAEAPSLPVPDSGGSVAHDSELMLRARNYVAEMEPAIAGQRGHDQTFNVACRLVIGFGLTPEQAWPIMCEFNTRCEPPWGDDDLWRKLREADRVGRERSAPRGVLRGAKSIAIDEYAAWQPLSGGAFIGYVPDFGLYDVQDALQPLESFVKRPWFDWFDQFAVASLRTDPAAVPDVFLRQLHWGALPPRNWRRELKRWREEKPVEERPLTIEEAELAKCAPDWCLLNRFHVRHQHFVSRTFHSSFVKLLAPSEEIRHDPNYDPAKAAQDTWLRHRKAGRIAPIYWPALLLGSSRRVKWTPSQQRLLVGIVRELTRAEDSTRGEAEIIYGNRVVGASRHAHIVVCPLLNADSSYVTFGGNGRLRGRGYMIVGRTFRGRLFHAGYRDSNSPRERRVMATEFLADLARLAADLDLTVVGYFPGHRFHKWRDLDELRGCLRSSGGREWLCGCSLRIYAPSDWLTRWRYFFSQRLGFRWIPRSQDDPGPRIEEPDVDPMRIRTASQVRHLLRQLRFSQDDLAFAVGEILGRSFSRQSVNRALTGRTHPEEFYEAVEELRIAADKQGLLDSRSLANHAG
jgi:hypothetical protein